MLVRATYTRIARFREKLEKVENPKEFTKYMLDRAYMTEGITLLDHINSVELIVPAAIDCIVAARGTIRLYEREMKDFIELNHERHELVGRGLVAEERLNAMFVTLAELTRQLEPDWEDPRVVVPTFETSELPKA